MGPKKAKGVYTDAPKPVEGEYTDVLENSYSHSNAPERLQNSYDQVNHPAPTADDTDDSDIPVIRNYAEGTGNVQPSNSDPLPSADQLLDSPRGTNEPLPSADQLSDTPPVGGAEPLPENMLPGNLRELGASAEGIARGVAGPFATAAELGLSKLGVPGLSAEDQAQRQKDYPGLQAQGETAGLVGSTLAAPVSGVAKGLGALNMAAQAAKASEAAAAAAKLGVVGSAALKGALQAGIIQGSDEISKAMIGNGDPEAPVASALLHVGGASLLGGALNSVVGAGKAGIGALAETKVGQAVAKTAADFGRQWKFIQGNLNPVESATNEINERMAHVDTMMRGGLKPELINKLTQDVSPQDVNRHIIDISKSLDNVSPVLKNEGSFKAAVDNWKNTVTPQRDPVTMQPTYSPKPADVFKATESLKRLVGEWGDYNKTFTPPSEQAWRNATHSVYSTLKDSLEDSDIWGPMGKAQADLNSKIAPMVNIQKEFRGKFTSPEKGILTADDAKVNTYLNQINRANTAGVKGNQIAGKKLNYIDNYLTQSQDLSDAYNKVHINNDIEPPFPSGLNATPVLNNSLDPSPTRGARIADWFADRNMPGLASSIATKGISATVGGIAGHAVAGMPGAIAGAGATEELTRHLTPLIKSAGGNALNKYAVPAALKVLSSGETAGLPEVMQHADNIAQGASKIRRAVDGLFKYGPQQIFNNTPDLIDRKRLRRYIENDRLGGQMQDEANQGPSPMQSPMQSPTPPQQQNYADGGIVSQDTAPEAQETSQPLISQSAVSTHFPTQAMMMTAAKTRISNYLNSIRPQEPSKLPFDTAHVDEAKERNYTKALDIANNPLSVLNHVKDGTITPDHLKHMTSMYPEVHSHLAKKITERMTQAQLKGERPEYKVRQAMSMFLGAATDATFNPASIQAAQSTFNKQQPQPQTPTTPKSGAKRSMNSLNKMPDQYKTADQSAEADRGGRKS